MGGLGSGGGLTKATAAGRRAIERALTQPCQLHPGRPAVAVILSLSMTRPAPACAECAQRALDLGGYGVIRAPGESWDPPVIAYENGNSRTLNGADHEQG